MPAMLTSKDVAALVSRELERIADQALLTRLQELLVTPYPVEREWDYGTPGERFTCWTVLEHASSNTAIAYCDRGFGPSYPWGLVFLSGPHMGIGMDALWHLTLESAMRESMAWDGSNPPGYEVP